MKQILSFIILVNILLSINLFASKSLYVSYKENPNVVYKNQRFEIIIKALITTEDFDYISVSFWNQKNIEILNPDRPWDKITTELYENRYYFKANDKFIMPNIVVKLIKGGQIIDISELVHLKMAYSDIAKGDKRFSRIIASNLNLNSYITKQYNNKESLTVISLEAFNSNLENFSLSDIEEQGISSLKDNYPKQELVYFFVQPVHKKKMVFNYYNTVSKSLIEVTIPLILQNELVSTQTDLNPNDSNFEKYKKIFMGFGLILFLILFIWKRKKTYLFFVIIFVVFLSIYFMPNKTALVKKGAFIYILPTKNSTIFFQVEKDEEVEILNTKKNFIKIIGKENKFIGWIKEGNLGKN